MCLLLFSGMIYIDPTTLRRSATVPVTAAAATAIPDANAVTMASTGAQLARAFGIVIRQIADLLTMLQDYHALAPQLSKILEVRRHRVSDVMLYNSIYIT